MTEPSLAWPITAYNRHWPGLAAPNKFTEVKRFTFEVAVKATSDFITLSRERLKAFPLVSALLRRLNPLSVSAWQVNNEMGLHLSVEGKVNTHCSPAAVRPLCLTL